VKSKWKDHIVPGDVLSRLRRHMLVDGYPIVVDLVKSAGCWLRDAQTGSDYLDFFGCFASNPLGFNHPSMLDARTRERLTIAATTKVSNSDLYSVFMAEFVETISHTCGTPELPYYFFVDGGALAVENAMKTAFDWKVRKNRRRGRPDGGSQILHFEDAFHGRSGYTLSVTCTDPRKTNLFPQFDWPRIRPPVLRFPVTDERHRQVVRDEEQTVADMDQAFDRRPGEIAAILIEPIQGEGGDNHFRAEFLRRLRQMADSREALLIFDEVQTGGGATGKWWAYQHFGVTPDIVCFSKRIQVGGIMVSRRVDEVEDHVFALSGRINSTWGGSLVDMVRATRILEIIQEEKLLDNASQRGDQLQEGLRVLQKSHDDLVDNVRGRGLMCAFDAPSRAVRDVIIERCFAEKLLILPCGQRGVRFRPALTIDAAAVVECLARLDGVLATLRPHVASERALDDCGSGFDQAYALG
jgi:L-lysine 6-transaminase